MPDYIKRMQEELSAIKDKREALGNFFSTYTYKNLPINKRSLMRSQHAAMKSYEHILELRVSLELEDYK